jgi:hypothetical protein
MDVVMLQHSRLHYNMMIISVHRRYLILSLPYCNICHALCTGSEEINCMVLNAYIFINTYSTALQMRKSTFTSGTNNNSKFLRLRI